MSWPLVLLVAAPVMAGLGSLLVQQRRAIEVLQCAQAGTMLAAAALVAGQVITAGEVSVGTFLQADALSAWLDLIIGFVGSSGTLYAVGYVGEELDRAHLSLTRYSQFFCLFDLYLAAMLLAVNLENIAIMWIAIEGSTLSAALLIGFDRSKAVRGLICSLTTMRIFKVFVSTLIFTLLSAFAVAQQTSRDGDS